MADPPRSNDDRFSEIVKEHRPYLLKLAMRFSGRKDVAEDLVQTALRRAWSHFAALRPESHVKGWLAKILTRCFLDYNKHKKVEQRALPILSAEEDIADDPLSREIPHKVLRDAIELLDEDEREMIAHWIAGKGYKQIADELGIPIGTVSSRMKRARDHLQELVTPAGLLK